MVASIIKTRNLYESYLQRQADGQTNIGNPGKARAAFVNDFKHRLGLCDRNGNNYTDRVGNRVLREADASIRIYPEQFSLKELMESIVGPGTSGYLQDAGLWGEWRQNNFAVDARHPGDPRALFENVGVGVMPSAFADINAWTAVNSGLIERRILEQFTSPDFIGDQICPDEQTKVAEGQKIIGAGRVGAKALERHPGMPHPRAGIPERWVELPRTHEYALAVDVTFEAAFFDLTAQVLETAAGIGEWLAFQKELRKIDAVIGVGASTGLNTGENAFKYNGTKYQLYDSTPTSPMPTNLVAAPLTNGDWQTIKTLWLLTQRMTDPETGTRINVQAKTALASLEGAILLDLITGARNVQRRTAGADTQATAAVLNVQDTDMNPAALGGRMIDKVLTSPLLEQRMTDATGLNLSQSDANKRWWMIQPGKAFKNMVNWPLQIAQMPMASSYEQTDRRILQSTFVSERSTPSVHSIWHCVQGNES